MNVPYQPTRPCQSRRLPVRGLEYHLHVWGDPMASDSPVLLMLHGFMDLGASFQFMVDAMREGRGIVAPDWRGFGRTAPAPAVDAYWFADYLGDLDALGDALSPDRPFDLLGHSMGGNVAMTYAGIRPSRVRRLINLEGFGLPDAPASEAPSRLALWLDQLKQPLSMKAHASREALAARLQHGNPRLGADQAAWLAGQWAEPDDLGRWHLRADASHRRVNPVLYRAEEALATWKAIQAPVLWVEGALSTPEAHWAGRYSRAEFHRRLSVVPDVRREILAEAAHMVHHDQPGTLARLVDGFLDAT